MKSPLVLCDGKKYSEFVQDQVWGRKRNAFQEGKVGTLESIPIGCISFE
jgi:hypothetical protein